VFLATTAKSAEYQVVNAFDPANMVVIRAVDIQGNLNGVDYISSIDGVVGASSGDGQELVIFLKG